MQESPEYIKMSLAAAMTLGYRSGRFYRYAHNKCINLLLTYGQGCAANCAYCGLARERKGQYAEKSFIRVEWPICPADETIERMTRSWVRDEEAGPAQAMVDSMTASILRSSMPKVSVDVGPAPAWLRTLKEGGERRRLEMPGSNAVVRFEGRPGGG